MFQFLIGRLKTNKRRPQNERKREKFQFLIGRLKTPVTAQALMKPDNSFNSS